MIFTAIVEDDEPIRAGIQSYLNRQDNIVCDCACGSIEEVLPKLREDAAIDVLIMDLGLPGMSGIEGMKLIKESYPEIDIIVFTVYNDPRKIFDSLCAGATGYLLKNTPLPDIRASIETLVSGGAPMSPQIARKVIDFFGKPKQAGVSPLSAKEKEIVIGLVDGLSYKLIANRLAISIETVRCHIKKIYRKLHVHSKAEVIAKSVRGEI